MWRNRSKYGAKSVEIDGMKFASKKEGEYYRIYKGMLERGEISDLRLQVPFLLLPEISEEVEEIKHLKTKDKVVRKKKVIQKATTYVADFVYKDGTGKEVVVDVKGSRRMLTKEFILKKKMMLSLLGIDVKVVV